MNSDTQRSWWRTPVGIAAIGLALVVAFYILREHYAHVFGALPYLLLLLCPLLHLFMHRGHGGHGHAGHADRAASRLPTGNSKT